MHKFERLKENAEKELQIIEDKGLEKGNVQMAGMLVEMVKGIDKINMMQDGDQYSRDRYSRDGEDYSWDGGYSRDNYDNGNSYRRGRNQRTGEYMHRPNYSRLSGEDTDMDRYRESKREYSNSRDEGSKGRMLDALEDFMCGVSSMAKQICRDADCREEREIVKKYAREIAEM